MASDPLKQIGKLIGEDLKLINRLENRLAPRNRISRLNGSTPLVMPVHTSAKKSFLSLNFNEGVTGLTQFHGATLSFLDSTVPFSTFEAVVPASIIGRVVNFTYTFIDTDGFITNELPPVDVLGVSNPFGHFSIPSSDLAGLYKISGNININSTNGGLDSSDNTDSNGLIVIIYVIAIYNGFTEDIINSVLVYLQPPIAGDNSSVCSYATGTSFVIDSVPLDEGAIVFMTVEYSNPDDLEGEFFGNAGITPIPALVTTLSIQKVQ